MLFHTWPFLVFILIVLPVYFALKGTRLWLPWLMLASYFFYGWWNPYYLILVFYSTILDYFLVGLMDHCPREANTVDLKRRVTRLDFGDRVLQVAFIFAAILTLTCVAMVIAGPLTVRPTMALLGLICLLMALGAL